MLEPMVRHQRRAALPQARQFCAFDILALDGDDLRQFPLSMRKTNLSGCWHVASTQPPRRKPQERSRRVEVRRRRAQLERLKHDDQQRRSLTAS